MLDYNESTRTATITLADKTQFTFSDCSRSAAEALHAKYMLPGSAAQTLQRDGQTIEHRMGRAGDGDG